MYLCMRRGVGACPRRCVVCVIDVERPPLRSLALCPASRQRRLLRYVLERRVWYIIVCGNVKVKGTAISKSRCPPVIKCGPLGVSQAGCDGHLHPLIVSKLAERHGLGEGDGNLPTFDQDSFLGVIKVTNMHIGSTLNKRKLPSGNT